jgi:hypothetical protein
MQKDKLAKVLKRYNLKSQQEPLTGLPQIFLADRKVQIVSRA